ncbi:MAG: carbohydrate kinase (thermoresistant glucokinase family) [Spirosomataceae bacterium]|jgi:carbohydrate kinase (thermoresistant glucokinase family)
MGVSGSGKTTIGDMLGKRLKLPFFDADNFHPKENIQKMSEGKPLNDDDRKGWLQAIHGKAVEILDEGEGAVITCSALKEVYRKTIVDGIEKSVKWIFLDGSYELIKKRMEARSHFMPPDLLKSQFDTLEKPEYGIQVSIENSPEEIIDKVISEI